MKTQLTDTERLLKDFDKICHKYLDANIDAKLLRKGINEIIDSHL